MTTSPFCFILLALVGILHAKRIVSHDLVGVREFDDEETTKFNTRRRFAGNPANLVDSDRLAILQKHNDYRSSVALGHTNGQPSAQYMEKLFWDPALETVATAYAKKCIWGHNSMRATQYSAQTNKAILYTSEAIGENLYMISSSSGSIDLLLNGVFWWYDEYRFYGFNGKTCQSGKICGHYTQLVWASTRYVGCGYAICSSLYNPNTGTHSRGGTMLVCDYLIAGNNGNHPYPAVTTGKAVCSGCPTDRQTCSAGMCSGCPAFAFYKCNTDKYSNCATTLANYCTNCGQTNQHAVCNWCPKTCKHCAAVTQAQISSPASCPPLNPTGGST